MPLIKDFYEVTAIHASDRNTLSAEILIDKAHPIFRGHFPDKPVTPGVCMLQMIKELGEEWAGTPLLLKTARNIKFLAIINPEINKKIRADLQFENGENGQLIVKSTIVFEDTIALKFSGIFQQVSTPHTANNEGLF